MIPSPIRLVPLRPLQTTLDAEKSVCADIFFIFLFSNVALFNGRVETYQRSIGYYRKRLVDSALRLLLLSASHFRSLSAGQQPHAVHDMVAAPEWVN